MLITTWDSCKVVSYSTSLSDFQSDGQTRSNKLRMELVVRISNIGASRNDHAVRDAVAGVVSIAFVLRVFRNGRGRSGRKNRGASGNGSPESVGSSITPHLSSGEVGHRATYSGNSGGWGGNRYILDKNESQGKRKVPRTYRDRSSGVGDGERTGDGGRRSYALDGGRCSWEKVM